MMIKDASRPSLFERVFSIKGVRSVICLMLVVLFVVDTARVVNLLVQFQPVSMTLYSGSGILVKGFPGGTARCVKISADTSVRPPLEQCGDLTNQNEFFISKAEINDSPDAKKFDKIENRVYGKEMIFLWFGVPKYRNKQSFWPVTAAYNINHPTLTVSSDKLSLTNIPKHNGQVFLTAAGDDWKVSLTTHAYGDHGEASSDSKDFQACVFASKAKGSIFALSQWNGPVEFPILVNVVEGGSTSIN
eukprot:860091_1